VESLQQHAEEIITWSGFAVQLGLALLFAFPTLKAKFRQTALLRRISKFGDAALHHVVLPDGLGGEIYIDHVVLNADGITVVKVQRYDGIIFAADSIENWTQVVGKRSYKFPNPLPELEASLSAIRALATDVVVRGYLLVLRGAEFPKGRPENVLPLSEAQEVIAAGDSAGETSDFAEGWQTLLSVAKPVPRDAGISPAQMQGEDTSELGGLIAISLLLSAAGWLTWRLTA